MKLKPYPKYKDSGVQCIGEIPEGWEVKELKYLVKDLSGNGFPEEEQGKDSGDIPFYKVSDINGPEKFVETANNFVSKKTTKNHNWNLIPEYSLIAPKIGEALKKNHRKITKVRCIIDNNCIAFKTFNVDYNYNYYLFKLINFEWFVNPGAVPSLSVEKLRSSMVPLAPLPDQTAIANFLDKKTSKIDALIEKDKKLIELLKERRASLINHAVTKGLDPNVKMKDSGIEWIGEIPEGWEVRKIKNNSYIKGRIGWHGLTSEEYSDEGAYLVTGTDFKNGYIKWENCYHVNWERYKEDPYIHLKKEDVLITKDGTIGKVAFIKELPDKATLNSGIFVVRPLNQKYKPKFMYWVLNSLAFERFFDFVKQGATISHLYQETFERFFFPIPPLPEQTAIVIFLNKATSKIDKNIKLIEKKINLLEEYKKSLIHNVVTGKVDVRGVEA